MSGAKETPRQKMIGMMYLVLTAMLALNVSTDILKAFTIVNESISTTNENFKIKVDGMYDEFSAALLKDGDKPDVVEAHKDAMSVQKATEKLIEVIRVAQDEVIGETEYGDKTSTNIEFETHNEKGDKITETAKRPHMIPASSFTAASDYDNPTRVMCGLSENHEGGRATDVKNAFIAYEKELRSILTPKEQDGLVLNIDLEKKWNRNSGKNENWETNNFYHVVLPATIALLNKNITDAQNIEANVLNKLKERIGATAFKFNKITQQVVHNSDIIMSGNDYVSGIFVAATDTTEPPIVIIKYGIDSISDDQKDKIQAGVDGFVSLGDSTNAAGMIEMRQKTSATGEFKYAGVIRVKKPNTDDEYVSYAFNKSYQVISPTATVSADAVNVVYKTLKNPMSVSASGYTNNQISLRVSGGGKLTSKGNGSYEFVPSRTAPKEITFFVSADGKQLAKKMFRVKNVPSPITRLAGVSDGKVKKDVVATRPQLLSQLDNFLFPIKYRVISFEILAFDPRTNKTVVYEKVSGGSLTGSIIAKLKRAPRGTKLSISQVRVLNTTTNERGAAAGVNLTLDN